ncbi:hypothetical protein [Vitiosangium sp. GDMCC 1.1324]|uniref:hypothetical protein n=1 Tax=Vitiosangium sp. (strain GDMCC 1.1324) TaxID=2138576 RepID=UPI000D3BFD30|nr:hypothetical protein [Vitiosangium sp. GDMCC 1.1324]PTL82751.1 hypothetical protein DAT35_18460 [Vitiosangium sp. GDMCC 1.1324]
MAIQNERRLRELLQISSGASVPDDNRPEYWDETFMRLGRGYGFDPEAGEYPVDHEDLFRDLLPLVSPLLNGARFTQVLPGEGDVEQEARALGPADAADEDGGLNSRYTLRLRHGGRRYSVTFHDISDYYNINAVLALLNAALEACGTSLRFFGFGDVVILGPLQGVQQAMREGFIPGFEGESIFEDWEMEELDAWSESGDTPESLVRQLAKGRDRVRISLVV